MDTERQMGENIKRCPVEITLKYIGKKWAINIIRDLFFGKKRFKDFLKSNPELSTKMLSTRLKNLQDAGIIEKRIVNKNPILIEYKLTSMGKALNKTLYELAIFSMEHHPKEVFHHVPNSASEYVPMVKNRFGL